MRAKLNLLFAATLAFVMPGAPAIAQDVILFNECLTPCFAAYPGRESECTRSCASVAGIYDPSGEIPSGNPLGLCDGANFCISPYPTASCYNAGLCYQH
jgi:hypothetical protein